MRRKSKIVLGAIALLTCVFAALVYFLFNGYFDGGLFEVKQTVWCSPKQVAIVAERSDNAALDGYQFFVLIGDHVFSPAELKHLYHSDAPVFSAAAECLNLRWESQTSLIIECEGGVVDWRHINSQEWKRDRIEISYKNIAQKK